MRAWDRRPAFYEGILEGANGNQTPIDYRNTIWREKAEGPGFLGVLRNGHFAAKMSALLQQQPDGSWKVSKQNVEGPGANGFALGINTPYFGETTRFAWDGGDGEGGDGGDGK
jgi:hypothetical protein